MSMDRKIRRQEALEASYEGTGSSKTVNYMFDWGAYADRLLISMKGDANKPVCDNTLLIRNVGIPFLDYSSASRENTDPKIVRIARFQNENGNQWLTSLNVEEKANPILKVLLDRGVFATVGKGASRRSVHATKEWFNIVSSNSSGVGSDGKSWTMGNGYRGQTRLLFQVIDRLDEENQTRTKLVMQDPYINDVTNELIWATPGFSSYMMEQAYKRLAARGTKYSSWEDFDMIIARHPQFQESGYGHFFGIAELNVVGNEDPYGSLKEDERLIEMFEQLAPYVNKDELDFNSLDTIDLDPLFPLSEVEPIFDHIKNVLKMIDKDIPGILEEVAESCGLSIDSYQLVDVANSTTSGAHSSDDVTDIKEISKPSTKKKTHTVNSEAIAKLSKYITGVNESGELKYTDEFYKLKPMQQRCYACEGCKEPVPVILTLCPFCGIPL